jgi:formylmethanofuran dehydrogenase subunit C
MSLILSYITPTPIPVEIEGLTPEAIREKSLDEIRRWEIVRGNRKLPLGEVFQVDGDPADMTWDMRGNLASVHWIGAHMREGTIRIHGPAGRHLGSQMRGGRITVDGDAGDWVGGEMHGGLIHVHGRAGDLVGAAYRGSAKGMSGGTILIDGAAGNEVGHSMLRGLIAIGGPAGDAICFNMLAGTVLVFGECGIRPGAGMRRGTIGLFGPARPQLLPTFRFACRYQPVVLSLLSLTLTDYDFPHQKVSEVALYNGDLLDGGRGEVLVRA